MTHKKDGIIDLLFCGFDYLRISRVDTYASMVNVLFHVNKLIGQKNCGNYRVTKQVLNRVLCICAIFQSSEKLGEVG